MASRSKQKQKKSKKVVENKSDDEAEHETWTTEYVKSWEAIEEDAFGQISWKNLKLAEMERKKRLSSTSLELRVEKGMLRYVYIILDCSRAMNIRDLKPNRMVVSQKMIETFITQFFDQNPLSQLGLIIAHHKVATKLTDLGGNPMQQIDKLHNITDLLIESEMSDNGTTPNCLSLQNALEIAKSSLSQIPIHGSREIILIAAALSTVDPDDIYKTIQALTVNKIRCNIISLSAEMHILSLIAKSTCGVFNVAMNESHFHDLLLRQVPPQPISKKSRDKNSNNRKWIKMGFPQQKSTTYPSLCFCHEKWNYKGYYCPKCSCKQCELPTDCTVCGLSLISSPHLVRSYHHVFPVNNFQEVKVNENQASFENENYICFGCQTKMDREKQLIETCQKCKHLFCIECNVFIHESLHNCPGCMSKV